MVINYNYKLLIFIVIIGLIILFATGIPGRVLIKLTAAEEYNNIYSEYENMYQNLNMKTIYEENHSNLMMKINKINLDTEILQDQIISVLSCISEKNNIELGNIKFSEIMPVNSIAKKELLSQQTQDSTAVCMKVTVDFNSDFNNMLLFVDNIKNCELQISVLDISILLIDDEKVHVMTNLMFYALPLTYSR